MSMSNTVDYLCAYISADLININGFFQFTFLSN